MMATQVLSDLKRQNVQVWREGDQLCVRAPRGVLTPELQSRLAQHKLDLLALLPEPRHSSGAGSLPSIIPDEEHRFEPFPLTDIQQAYWVGRREGIELGSVSCHAYYEVDAKDIDLLRLGVALEKLIERHDMLRAIVMRDGTQQVLDQVSEYEIEVLDLCGLGSGSAEAVLSEIRERMSHQVLPAGRWPLFRVRASRLADNRYRLHFSFDILIADVLSLKLLFREWEKLYLDPTARLSPIELRFRDYVLAEPAVRDSIDYQASRQYWAERLSDLPPGPDLPLALRPSEVSSPRFVRRSGRLEATLWKRVKERSSEFGVSPSVTLLTAFAEVLRTWSKSPKFTINVTLLNRLPIHEQVNQIIGDFTSLVALAVDTSPEAEFRARADRIQARLLEDMEHRLASGIGVLRDLARVQGRPPGAVLPVVFTSLLSQRLAESGRTLWMGEVVYGITQTPQVWLDHQVLEENGALLINWDAVEDLFPAGLLDEMFEAYWSLLRRLGEGESWRQPARVPLPLAILREQAEANSTDTPTPNVTLHDLFLRQAVERPGQQAIIAANGSLTYEDLQYRADALARALTRAAVQPGSLVAVVMDKGWEQVAAVLGILQSGAAYLPIDPALPKQRLWHLLKHGEVEVALTQSRIDSSLEWPAGIRRLSVDSCMGDLGGGPVGTTVRPDDLAYVIYTSGSTGTPKGVMIDHAGAVNTILDVNRRFAVGPGDRVLALSSLSFDLSVYDIFGTLAAGGTIIIPEASAVRDPERWAELIERENVTVWNSVPALMEMLVAYGSERQPFAESLRLVLLSGDWIPVKLPEQTRSLAPNAAVISLGGATEASIWSILHPINRVPPTAASIPYGRPMANQRFYVLSEGMEQRPTWVPGELYIGGAGLARGYWRDEERTNSSFIFHPRTGERLYRSGDFGRYLPDGNIEFLGREDHQVKIGGRRVELGEIEAVLSTHPEVRLAAVKAVGPRDSRRLAAYAAIDRSSTAEDLRLFLKQKLPAYMVPTDFVILDSLPLTTNGKVSRAALPDPIRRERADLSLFAADSLEARIAQCVTNVLKCGKLDARTNLIEAGATSMDMIRVAIALEKELNLRPRIEDLYDDPSIGGLARFFREQSGRGAPASSSVPLGREEGEL